MSVCVYVCVFTEGKKCVQVKNKEKQMGKKLKSPNNPTNQQTQKTWVEL